jgi:asparagine synthase (glutamine-hydrolysing)
VCGLNAIFAYGPSAPPVNEAELTRVRDYMAARGPDGAGAWIANDRRVGLGHRRLAIIDLDDRALQPMASTDGRLRIVFNGEIYNYRALRAELAARGARFVTESDTEVLLHLYARDGAAMVERLRGMYAFAIWDESKQGMLLARDPFGIKPLYVADDGRTIRVASQVKALLVGAGIDTKPSAAGTAGFFLLGYVPEPHTLYRGIRALQSGTTLWIAADGTRSERRFFDLTELLAKAEERPAPTAAPERLREILADSVAHHFVADVEVGVFLSAGIDSATITALSAELKGSRLRTITLGFDEYRGTAFDEPPLAEEVAAACRTTHETRRVRRADFEAEFPRIVAAMDQPSIDGVNTYFVSKVAAEAGLKVALSGLGGDEFFAGYPSFQQVPSLLGKVGAFGASPWFGRAFRVVTSPVARRFTSPKYAGVFEYGTTASDAWLLRRGLFMPWEMAAVIGPDMAREGLAELAIRERLAATESPLRSPRLKVTALEASWYMRSQLLRDSDWAGMAHSLEIRVPLVDATFVSELAPLIAASNPPGKRDLAATPRQPLPRALVERPKTGFVVPVREWLTEGLARAGMMSPQERGFRGWARAVMAAHRGAEAL